MSAKKNTYIPGQSPLFEGDPSRHMRTWQEVEPEPDETTVPTNYGPEGAYVDVSDRAEHLSNALSAFSSRNQRLGFDIAANTRPHSGPIWGRYTEMTPVVMEGAQRNVDEFYRQAAREFWVATGFSAMRGLGLMTDGEIDARARKMWRQFSEKFGDPNKLKARTKYKRQLRKAIRQENDDQKAA